MKTLVFYIALSVASAASAGPLVNQQGRLTNAVGVVVDGTYSLTFSLYDSAVEGTKIWSETHVAVPILGGAFSLQLGSVTDLPDDIFSANPTLYLQLTVEAEDPLPRQFIQSVPRAYTASHLHCSGCIKSAQIAAEAVSTDQIANAAVTKNKLAALSVGTGKLVDKNVTTAKLADNSVLTSKLGPFSVTEAKLHDLAVSTAKIANNAVTNAKLAPGAVGTDTCTWRNAPGGCVGGATKQTVACLKGEYVAGVRTHQACSINNSTYKTRSDIYCCLLQ